MKKTAKQFNRLNASLIVLLFAVLIVPFAFADTSILITWLNTGSVADTALTAVHPAAGVGNVSAVSQSFTVGAESFYLDQARFSLKKQSSPVGYLKAALYNISGTPGSNSYPIESELIEVSIDAYDMSTLTTSYPSTTAAENWMMFNFSGTTLLENNTYYHIAVYVENATTIDTSANKVLVSRTLGGRADNNAAYYANGAWAAQATIDAYVIVYGTNANGHGQLLFNNADPGIEINQVLIRAVHPSATTSQSAFAQTFLPLYANTPGSFVVWLGITGAPAANLTAKICGITGSYGTTAVPNETDLICESTTLIDTSTLHLTPEPVYFYFDTAEVLDNTTYYAFVVYCANGTIDNSNYVWTPRGLNSEPSNYAYYASSTWGASTYDLFNYIYAEPTPTPEETPTPTPEETPTPTPTPTASPTPTPSSGGSPTPSATPTPTPILIEVGAGEPVNLYFRSDTYTTLNFSAYGLDRDFTNNSTSFSGSLPAYVGFRVWLYSSDEVSEELTDGVKGTVELAAVAAAQYATNTFDFAGVDVVLGYQALEVIMYTSPDNSSWTARATFVSPVLITEAILPSEWTFVVYADTSDVNYAVYWDTYQFKSGITNMLFEEPDFYAVELWRLSNGDLIGFLVAPYLIALPFEAVYALILLGFAGSLYRRYQNAGTIIFFFALFGGAGGLALVWLPLYAAAPLAAVVILGTAFLVWRLIR